MGTPATKVRELSQFDKSLQDTGMGKNNPALNVPGMVTIVVKLSG